MCAHPPRTHVHRPFKHACACGVTLLLCLCSACVVARHPHEHKCAAGSCRVLAEADAEHAIDRGSFVSWLGSEGPAQHVLALYQGSGDSRGVVPWILEASGKACSASAEAVDPHAGHDHRRRLQQAADDEHAGHGHEAHAHEEAGHDDHAEDQHAHGAAEADVHPHVEDEPNAHSDHTHADSGTEEADGHSGHAHGEVSGLTVLTAESLRSSPTSAANGNADVETVQRALSFITACQVDPDCVLESNLDIEVQHDTDSRAFFGLKTALALSFIPMTLIASYLPLLFMRSTHYNGILTCLNAFSGAVFLTVGVLHLLPHVAEYELAADLQTDYPVGLSFVVCGFVIVLFVEQVLFNVHDHNKQDSGVEEARSQDVPLLEKTRSMALTYKDPLLTEVAVGLHAVLECITMGLAQSKEDTLLLFAAICAHKVFTAMSLSTRFLRLGAPPGMLFLLMSPFHILPPVAVIAAAGAGANSPLASLVLVGLATGTFLYVGAFEVVCEEFADHSGGGHASPTATQGAISGGAVERSDGDSKGHGPSQEWTPGKGVKFFMFVLGCGALLGITAALPHHSH